MNNGVKNVVSAVHSKYVTVSEAARHLRVSRNTIYEACRENEIDCIRIRSCLRIWIDLSEEYLTVAETADYLQTSPSTVYAACSMPPDDEKRVDNIRIRSRIRIPLSYLLRSSLGDKNWNPGSMPPVFPAVQPAAMMS
jgi:excisionase family DNA binding protein